MANGHGSLPVHQHESNGASHVGAPSDDGAPASLQRSPAIPLKEGDSGPGCAGERYVPLSEVKPAEVFRVHPLRILSRRKRVQNLFSGSAGREGRLKYDPIYFGSPVQCGKLL